MPKMTEADKGAIFAIRSENLGLRKISAKVGFSKASEGNFLRKICENRNS